MKTYPLEALRRVHQDRAERAHAEVVASARRSALAEDERRREEDRLGTLEQRIAERDLPDAVLELRALAAMSAHRSLLIGRRACARNELAKAAARAGAARALLERALEEQRDLARSREGIESHHAAWRRKKDREREAAEERCADEVVAAGWGRTPPG